MAPATGELTETQRNVLDLIRTTVAARGYPPTVTELARATGTWQSAVREVLATLERKRCLRLVPWDARTLIVLEREATP